MQNSVYQKFKGEFYWKEFHIIKNGMIIGVFEEMPVHINNVVDENFINDLENPK